jgi:signal transduction histidine kinase
VTTGASRASAVTRTSAGDTKARVDHVARPAGPAADTAAAAIPDPLGALVDRAAARVLAAPQSIESGTQLEDLRAQMSALGTALVQGWTGDAVIVERAAPAAPVQRLLGRWRAAVVEELASQPGAVASVEEVVTLLRAFERVQAVLEADDAQRFANRLAGVGGLDLLVEVAHDLRSPLSSILFLAETIRKGQSGPVAPEQERQLGLIYSAAFGLSAMSSDVIELVRGADRLTDVEPVPFSVSDVMNGVRDIVLPIAEEKKLDLRLAPPDADFRLGHPGALNRVLLNLTTNALKFTAEGFVEIAAKQRTRTRLDFSVRDTGRGIPPDVMSCLFETFRRRRSVGDYSFSSAGLGLSISRRLIRGLGGDLVVDTELGKGTRFRFELDLPVAPRL